MHAAERPQSGRPPTHCYTRASGLPKCINFRILKNSYDGWPDSWSTIASPHRICHGRTGDGVATGAALHASDLAYGSRSEVVSSQRGFSVGRLSMFCLCQRNQKEFMREEMPDFSDVQSGSSSTAPSTAPKIYEVVPGDSLSKIAKREYGNAGEWKRIFEANRDILKDPDKIYPGQKLKLPPHP